MGKAQKTVKPGGGGKAKINNQKYAIGAVPIKEKEQKTKKSK